MVETFTSRCREVRDGAWLGRVSHRAGVASGAAAQHADCGAGLPRGAPEIGACPPRPSPPGGGRRRALNGARALLHDSLTLELTRGTARSTTPQEDDVTVSQILLVLF